ncbi:hypothetical protein BDZ89DRAFT_1108365 [Hymenopellis radicata]|nr:hypothetical protein BDZ89DRAFT_1108365 [Hymenopellis radicata]
MNQTGGATFNYKASSTIYNALTSPSTSVTRDPPKPGLPCPRFHILGVHLGTRFSCPVEGCPSDFAQYSSLIRHVVGECQPNLKNSGKHMDVIEDYKLKESFSTNATGMIVCSEHGYLEFTPDREFASKFITSRTFTISTDEV